MENYINIIQIYEVGSLSPSIAREIHFRFSVYIENMHWIIIITTLPPFKEIRSNQFKQVQLTLSIHLHFSKWQLILRLVNEKPFSKGLFVLTVLCFGLVVFFFFDLKIINF